MYIVTMCDSFLDVLLLQETYSKFTLRFTCLNPSHNHCSININY